MRLADITTATYLFVQPRSPEANVALMALMKAAKTLDFSEREMRGHMSPEKVELLRASFMLVVQAIDAERAKPTETRLRVCEPAEMGIVT